MVFGAVVLGVPGVVLAGSAGRFLLWLRRMRQVSDVTGIVVGRDRQFTGRIVRTLPRPRPRSAGCTAPTKPISWRLLRLVPALQG